MGKHVYPESWVTHGVLTRFSKEVTGRGERAGSGATAFLRGLVEVHAVPTHVAESMGSSSKFVIQRTVPSHEVDERLGGDAMLLLLDNEAAEAVGLSPRQYETLRAFYHVSTLASGVSKADNTQPPLVGQIVGYDWRPEPAFQTEGFLAAVEGPSTASHVFALTHDLRLHADALHEMALPTTKLDLITTRGYDMGGK